MNPIKLKALMESLATAQTEADKLLQELVELQARTTQQFDEADAQLRETDRQLQETDGQLQVVEQQIKAMEVHVKNTNREVQVTNVHFTEAAQELDVAYQEFQKLQHHMLH